MVKCVEKVADTLVHKYKENYVEIIQLIVSNLTVYSQEYIEEEIQKENSGDLLSIKETQKYWFWKLCGDLDSMMSGFIDSSFHIFYQL